VYAKACELGLEAIASKRVGSFYHSGPSRDWLKENKRPKTLPKLRSLAKERFLALAARS